MTNEKKRDEKLSLDMPFNEALERFAQTDPDETLDVRKEGMAEDTIDDLLDAFEACAHRTDDGQESWYARDLQKLFEYGEWRFFRNALERAIAACEQSGREPRNHFVHVHEMVEIGSGASRKVDDMQLSRYACYLTAQNSDARKKPVAFAQTYFAIQTRRQELADQAVAVPMSEDEKRVYLRNQIKEHNKHLSSAAKGAGVVTPQEFAIFHSNGYQGLYGMTAPEIVRYKSLPKSAKILDRMGSTELAANFFRVTQTEEKLRGENVQGKQEAYRTHYEVGRQVRDAMLKISGIAPEDLEVVDSIKSAEKRLKAEAPLAAKLPDEDDEPIVIPDDDEPADQPVVDLRKDLWKYALLVMVQRPNMEISTTDLISELPSYIAVPPETEDKNASRGDTKFSQIVRNLKSHKDASTNFIRLGYAEAIPRGFRATEKGRQFVLEFFKDRL